MKRKIFSILLTLVLVLSFGLVTAVPVSAVDHEPSGTAPQMEEISGLNVVTSDTWDVSTGIVELVFDFADGGVGVTKLELDWSLEPYTQDRKAQTNFLATEDMGIDPGVLAAMAEVGLVPSYNVEETKWTLRIDTNATMTADIFATGIFGWVDNIDDPVFPPGRYDWYIKVHSADETISWGSMGGEGNPPIPDYSHYVGYFHSIQSAIDDADVGDTIIVHTGTYAEDLTIPATKANLELKSASGAAVTTIKGVQVGTWPTHVPGIDVLASGVKIHGFTIESPDYPAGKHSSGIIVGAANVEIYENSFVIKDDGSGNGWGVSIETYGAWAGDVSGLNIHHNTFTSMTGTDMGSEGIYINYNSASDPPAGTITIADNTFGGQFWRVITTERSKTTISGNTISSSYAPFVGGSPFNAAFRGIDISSTGGNLNPDQNTVVMTGNTVSGFYWGFCLGATNNNLTNITLTNNTVETNTIGIRVRSSAGGVFVNYNNISGNTAYGVDNTDTANLNATNNWWGHASGPSGPDGRVNKKGKVIGKGDAISGNVDWDPWLRMKVWTNPAGKDLPPRK